MKKSCEACFLLTFCDEHHIMSQSYGGTNAKSNLTNICPTCHRLVHKGEIILEGKFLTSDGIKLIWHNIGEESITGREPKVFIMGGK